MNTQVDILLSTFNNSNFLESLLKSLNNQTYKNFKLLVRDDGSNDTIKQFIKSAISEFDNFELTDSKKNIGYFLSFCELINSSKSDLIFLCDHDDIWHDEKIEKFVVEFESYHNKEKPLLICSDLNIIDENSRFISRSYFKAMNFNPAKSSDSLFIRNSIPGCALAFNQPLKELFQKTEKVLPYHDHILILIALLYGEIIYIDKTLISYRIHDSNTIGRIALSRSEKISNLIDTYRFGFRYKKFIESRFSSFLEQIQIILDSNYREFNSVNKNLIAELISNKKKYFAPRDISERIKLFFLR